MSSLTCCLFHWWLISKCYWCSWAWDILSFLWRLLGTANTCLQRDSKIICWLGERLFEYVRWQKLLFICLAASPVKLPADFAVCRLCWSVPFQFFLVLVWLLKTHGHPLVFSKSSRSNMPCNDACQWATTRCQYSSMLHRPVDGVGWAAAFGFSSSGAAPDWLPVVTKLSFGFCSSCKGHRCYPSSILK